MDTEGQIFAGPLAASLDRNAMAGMAEMFFEAFPDITHEIVHAIDLGDGWVVTELVATGTHQGLFMGIPPMGYPTELEVVWLMRYNSDGQLTEGSFYYDNLTLMTQMTTAPDYSPAGTWVVSVATPVGTIRMIHTVSPQEKPGGSFAGVLHQVNENPTLFGYLPEEADYYSDWVTQTIWKGRNKVVSTMLTYGAKYGEGPLAETTVILVTHVEWTLTGPDTNEGTAVMGVYLAAQDVDNDGFPDAGEEPVLCIPFEFTSRRLGQLPIPCFPGLQ
jgi:predicted ester cyclase